MKKYLLGLTAIAFAIVGNSFTTHKKTDTQYYWYDEYLTPLFGGVKMEEYPFGCDDMGTNVCAYAHEEEIHTPGVDPSLVTHYLAK
jgi:hypothetical protein